MKMGTVTIPNSLNKCLIYFLILWVMAEEFLISTFSFPAVLRYLNDVIILWLLLHCLLNVGQIGSAFRKNGYLGVLGALTVYSVYLLLGIILNGVPLLQVLWALRNTYRFFVFYIACVLFLDGEDVSRLFRWLCRLQWVNLALGLYQYFVLDQKQDYLGGLFGTEKGCNALLNIYLCFVTAYVLLQYMERQKGLFYLLCTMMNTMLLAALSELKILFVEIPILVLGLLLLHPKRFKAIGVLLMAVICMVAGLFVLREVFPSHFEVLTHLEQLILYGNSGEGGYGLSRFQAFENINRLFFHDSTFYNLFGFGLGSCEYSTFDFLTSDFYRMYGGYNYRWFAHQMIFLETGYLGLLLYLSVIGAMFFSALGIRKKQKRESLENSLVLLMCVVTVISIWYNASVRTEVGYLLFFALTGDAVLHKRWEGEMSPVRVRQTLRLKRSF